MSASQPASPARAQAAFINSLAISALGESVWPTAASASAASQLKDSPLPLLALAFALLFAGRPSWRQLDLA